MASLKNNTPAIILGSLLLIILLGIIDYNTGIEFNFFVFYYIPIALSTWSADRRWGLFNSILSASTWTVIDIISEHQYPHWSYYAWNGGIRLLSFAFLAVGLSKIKKMLEMEKELALNLRAALDEVKLLKGFLPICSSCKNIRNDQGYWEQIEQYVSSHSGAEFTHTLCPDCIKKLYPDLDKR